MKPPGAPPRASPGSGSGAAAPDIRQSVLMHPQTDLGPATHLADVTEDVTLQDDSDLEQAAFSGRSARKSERYAPLSWEAYFDEERDVDIPGTSDVFHVYLAGKDGPVLFCLHGGGYTGLSFAAVAPALKQHCRVVAMDLRGHGRTRTSNDSDLSVGTLCKDVITVFQALYGTNKVNQPQVVLIGHSMGGAVAVRTAALGALPTLSGLVVVDVVEGTAMGSLAFMQTVLANRPSSFPTLSKAIEWSYRSGAVRNEESARVSVPAQLTRDQSGAERYVWRARLEESEPYWKSWYEGLSDVFTSCPVPKLLLLAGTDRLDRPLTIGQMQGKFQMMVFRTAGHAIQEDEPAQFADAINGFVSRNRIGGGGLQLGGPGWKPVLRA